MEFRRHKHERITIQEIDQTMIYVTMSNGMNEVRFPMSFNTGDDKVKYVQWALLEIAYKGFQRVA